MFHFYSLKGRQNYSVMAKQMEFNRFMLLGFIFILFLLVSSTYLKESFTDVSGDYVSISMKDLLTLLSDSKNTTNNKFPTYTVEKEEKEVTNEVDKQFYNSIKGDLLQEVRTTVREEMKKKEEGSVLSDSCIESISNQQGTDWIKYIPGKNPDDYIRKDSIPCYGCSLK
jgi:hypothetical protein